VKIKDASRRRKARRGTVRKKSLLVLSWKFYVDSLKNVYFRNGEGETQGRKEELGRKREAYSAFACVRVRRGKKMNRRGTWDIQETVLGKEKGRPVQRNLGRWLRLHIGGKKKRKTGESESNGGREIKSSYLMYEVLNFCEYREGNWGGLR